MSHTLFIADLHLEQEREDISALFCQFLKNEAPHADALYILGDLFEVWIGDDNPCPFHAFIASQIKQLSDGGVPVFFIHGNRDFTIGKRFAKASGMTLLPELALVDLYGQSTLIMHGDSLCTKDIAYQKFRKKSRTKWWQMLMLSLPLFVRKKMARNIRNRSKENKQRVDLSIMDVTPSEVIKVMDQYQVSRLIHGHTHRPNIHQQIQHGKEYQRIVLGDWYEQGSILSVSATQIDLTNQPFIK